MKSASPALTHNRRVGCGTLHITLSYNEETHKPLRCQIILGKSGGCAHAQLNCIQNLINIMIRENIDISELYDKDSDYSLIAIRCPEVQTEQEMESGELDGETNFSCGDVIAKTLRYLIGKLEDKK